MNVNSDEHACEELVDDFLKDAGKVLSDEQVESIKIEDNESSGKISKAWAFFRNGVSKLQSGIVAIATSDLAKNYTDTAKYVAMDVVELKLAEILQRAFWELVEKYLGHFDNKVIRFFTKNPYGQALVLALVAIPLSGAFRSRVQVYMDEGDEGKAKKCLFLSRVIMKMSLSKGMDAFNVDALISKGLDRIFSLLDKAGVDLEEEVSKIPNDALKEATGGKTNSKKMQRR